MIIEEKRIKLNEIIKRNNLAELKSYVKENSITPEKFNNFNDILIESIENNASSEIIEFIISQRLGKNLNYYTYNNESRFDNRIIKIPIYSAIINKNYEISNLLLKFNANINYVINGCNIIEYLLTYEQPVITIKSLRYILNNGFNRKNINKDLIFNLIKTKQNHALKIIIKFYRRLDSNTILNTFLISMYKNKIPCSRRELVNLLSQLHPIEIDDTMYEHAIYYNNDDAVKILFENDESEANRLFIRIIKYNILENAINSNNYNLIEKVLSYKTFCYQYQGFKRKKLRLTEIIDKYIPLVLRKPENITKLVIKTFLMESNKINQDSNRDYDIRYLIYLLNMFIRENRIDLVNYLISSQDYKLTKDDINTKDIKGEYPVVTAVVNKHSDLFKKLIKIGADINTKNKELSSLLLLSIRYSPNLAEFLLDMPNLNINDINKKGDYPLLEAMNNEYVELVALIIDYSKKNNIILDVNKADCNKNYPLLVSIHHNNYLFFQMLLKYSRNYNIILNINEKNSLDSYPLLTAISNNNIYMTNLLINYAEEFNINLDINETDLQGNYPLIIAIKNNNSKLIQLLFDYSNRHNIVLNINNGHKNSLNSPFLEAFQQNNMSIIYLLIEYGDKHDIKIDVNREGCNGNYPLLAAVKNNSIKDIKFLMTYAEKHQIILDVNKKDNTNNFPFFEAIINKYEDILHLLIEYCNKNNIILNMNNKGHGGISPFLASILTDNISIIELIIEYSQKHNIILDINEKDDYNFYPLLTVINRGNVTVAKLLIKYAMDNNIILDFNDSDREIGEMCPFHYAISRNDMEMIKLLINYGEKCNVIIDLNGKDQRGNYLFLEAVHQDNIEAVQLLIDYAERNNIIIKINEKDCFDNYPLFMAIYRGNATIVRLIIEYCRRHKIKLDINQPNEFGCYPLDYLLDEHCNEITKLLIDYASKNNIIMKRRSHNKRRKYF